MFNFSKTAKNIILTQLFLSFVFLVICFFITNKTNTLFFTIGLTVGGLFAAVKLILLERTLEKSLDMSQADAALYVRSQYFFRYVLSFLILIGLALFDGHWSYGGSFSLYGGCIALICLQISVYIVNFFIKEKQVL